MKTKDIAKSHAIDLDAFDAWLKQSSFTFNTGLMGGLALHPSQSVDQVVSEYRKFLAAAAEHFPDVVSDKERVLAEVTASTELAREIASQEERRANDEEQRAKDDKQRALAGMLITSGFNFDGYTITKYSGYISGDDAAQVDRPTRGWLGGMSSSVGGDMLAALVQIRRNALAELKEAAYALGCNAVIGVDFDYLTLDPETVTPQGGTLYLPFLFAVTANGNAVVIERIGQTPRA